MIIFHRVIYCSSNFVFFLHQRTIYHHMFWHLFAHFTKTVSMIKFRNFVNMQKFHKFNLFNSRLCDQIVFFLLIWCVISFSIFPNLRFGLTLNVLIDFDKSFNAQFNDSWILCAKIVFYQHHFSWFVFYCFSFSRVICSQFINFN